MLPPRHKKVPQCALCGAGWHILMVICSRGEEMLPPGHKKVPQCALCGAGGCILMVICSHRGEMLPPRHKKVPQCANCGAGWHILMAICSHREEMLPPAAVCVQNVSAWAQKTASPEGRLFEKYLILWVGKSVPHRKSPEGEITPTQ